LFHLLPFFFLFPTVDFRLFVFESASMLFFTPRGKSTFQIFSFLHRFFSLFVSLPFVSPFNGEKPEQHKLESIPVSPHTARTDIVTPSLPSLTSSAGSFLASSPVHLPSSFPPPEPPFGTFSGLRTLIVVLDGLLAIL